MKIINTLPSPVQLKEQLTLSSAEVDARISRIREVQDVLAGRSKKLLLIIGPCSADSSDAVLDYVDRLSSLQKKVNNQFIIVPRIYTCKPRTTGEGYKGMLHQPKLDQEENILEGQTFV